MNSFEFNKIAGAVLGTLLMVMGLGIVADTIFHSGELETPGYVVEVPEDDGASTQTAEAPAEEPISVLLATATAEAGESVARKCAACHSFEEGGANKVGPNLWNIVNATPAAKDGFNYSSALQEYSESNVWAYENLSNFLAAPKNYISGTSMGFVGLKKPDERADMIAYLRSLSNAPAALPVPDPEPIVEPAGEETPPEAASDDAAEPEAVESEAAEPEAAVPEAAEPEAEMEQPAADAPEATEGTMEETPEQPMEEAAPETEESSETPAN